MPNRVKANPEKKKASATRCCTGPAAGLLERHSRSLLFPGRSLGAIGTCRLAITNIIPLCGLYVNPQFSRVVGRTGFEPVTADCESAVSANCTSAPLPQLYPTSHALSTRRVVQRRQRMATYNYDTEAIPYLTTNADEAVCICDLCNRMYTKRPFLCLCKSNVFLQDIKAEKVSATDAPKGE